MKNLFYLLLLITSISYSQNFSEKWNSVYSRYDYHDTNGNLIGYKKWNSVYSRWDYTQLNSSNSNVTPVYAPVDQGGSLDIAQKVLIEKQRRYDVNFAKLKEVNTVNIDYLKAVSINKGLSYDKAYNRYINEYWNKVMRGNYDISANSTLDSLLDYLTKGVGYIACVELKDCTLYNN
jgi:hypothetical protein